MSNSIALTRLASPTASPVISGGVALFTTATAALSNGTPMELVGVASVVGASMLVDLVKSIPGQRQADHADQTLHKLKQDMADLHVQMAGWTNQQYQFFVSMVENILSAGDADKMEFLRRAALNAALNGAAVNVGGAFLARVIRDVTSPEIAYMVMHFGKNPLLPHAAISDEKRNSLPAMARDLGTVLVETENDQEIVTGLQTLGLLRNGANRYAAQDLVWTGTAGKILALVSQPPVVAPARPDPCNP